VAALAMLNFEMTMQDDLLFGMAQIYGVIGLFFSADLVLLL
jgi:hypothetical protein